MKTIHLFVLTGLAAALVAGSTFARGGPGAGRGAGAQNGRAANAGVCPWGYEPGTGPGAMHRGAMRQGGGGGGGNGVQQRIRARDGSCVAGTTTAPDSPAPAAPADNAAGSPNRAQTGK